MPAKDLIASLTPEMIAKIPPEELILPLISVLEDTLTELENSREANRTLKNEINRLKGEQGRPEIATKKKKKGDSCGVRLKKAMLFDCGAIPSLSPFRVSLPWRALPVMTGYRGRYCRKPHRCSNNAFN